MVILKDFVLNLKRYNQLVQHNKQHHRETLLSSFRLNGHTQEFLRQTQKLVLPCTAQ